MMSYWGYKFETLSLLPQPWDSTSRDFIEGRDDMVVDNHAQYCSVVKTGMGKTKLVLGGEVDAVWDCKPPPPADPPPPPPPMTADGGDGNGDVGFNLPPPPPPPPQQSQQQQQQSQKPINWVELKTAAEITSDRDILKFERKLLKFWIQSFLLGVPKIVIGFRSPTGTLLRLEELETKDIPGMVKKRGRRGSNGSSSNRGPGVGPGAGPGQGQGQQATWDGNVCINFTAAFLDWLKKTMAEEGDGDGVWRIRRRERSPVIEIFRVEGEEEGMEVVVGTGGILSREFVDWRMSLTGL